MHNIKILEFFHYDFQPNFIKEFQELINKGEHHNFEEIPDKDKKLYRYKNKYTPLHFCNNLYVYKFINEIRCIDIKHTLISPELTYANTGISPKQAYIVLSILFKFTFHIPYFLSQNKKYKQMLNPKIA